MLTTWRLKPDGQVALFGSAAQHGSAQYQHRGQANAPRQWPVRYQQQQRGRRQRRDVAQNADAAGVAFFKRGIPQEKRRTQRAQAHNGHQQPVAPGK